jgi:hypothetical protein
MCAFVQAPDAAAVLESQQLAAISAGTEGLMLKFLDGELRLEFLDVCIDACFSACF